MSADNSPRQGQAPEVSGGVPQATNLPGPQPGPEPMSLPESQEGTGGKTNWEALFQEERGRRQGLDRRIQEIQQGFETEREKLTQQLTQLQQQLEKRPEAPSEPPVSTGNQEAPAEGEVSTALQQMKSDLAQLQAAHHRDSLLREYMGPGKPGEGLDLYNYSDYIPVHPAKVDGEGNADDSAQRKAIEGLIERLKAERGQAAKATEQEMVSGSTTGSSPPPGAPTTAQSGWEEYQRVKAEVNNPDAMAELNAAQRKAKMDHYYELLGKFGHRDAGFKAPWISSQEMYQMIRNMSAQIDQLSGK